MITVEQFNSLVRRTIETNKTQIEIENNYSVDYELLDRRWLDIEYNDFIDTISCFYQLLGSLECRKRLYSIYLKYNYNRFIKNKLLNFSWYKYKLYK